MEYVEHVVDLVGNTPLVKLNSLTSGIKATVLAKVEYLNPGGGSLMPDTGLGDVAKGIGTIAEAVQKTAVWMADTRNWVRVGYVVGGVLLAGMGLQIIAKPAVSKATPALRTASKVAKKVTK